MVSQRKAWEKLMKCKPYICPTCGRDKGMLYLFLDGTLRYVCFCGSNISVRWINDSYDFDIKKFILNEEEVKNKGSFNKSLSIPNSKKSSKSNNNYVVRKGSPKFTNHSKE